MLVARKLCTRSLAVLSSAAWLAAVAAPPASAEVTTAAHRPASSTADTTQVMAPLVARRPEAVPLPPPVVAPVSVDPQGAPARGTMIMVYGSGWSGHSGYAQDQLLKNPGSLFLARGWRVVSIDYDDGGDGLQDVLNATGAELARKSSDGPVCIYGESSGAHLALLAASRLSAVDCVIGVGTPSDLVLYQAEAQASSDPRVHLVAGQINRFFGSTLAETAPWELAPVARGIRADVMLLHEADDELVTAAHAERFRAERPTTQVIELEAGDKNDPGTRFIHGTASTAGRAQYASAVGSFADRAVAARDAERVAVRTGCPQVTRSLTHSSVATLQNALRCLTRSDAGQPASSGRWQQTSVKLRGEINAARVWASLRGFKSGRRALAAAAARRAKVIVEMSDRSRVTLRATRR